MINDKYLQAFAHFYRGEMNRLTCYRMRLDGTFQYSIILTSGFLIFYLGQSILITRFFPLIIIFINLFFCFIETRRYRYYLIIQKRINLMERGFLCHQILSESISEEWSNSIIDVYQNVDFTHSFIYCFLLRYFRNYVWLIDLIVIIWNVYPLSNKYMFWVIEIIFMIQNVGIFIFYKEPDI